MTKDLIDEWTEKELIKRVKLTKHCEEIELEGELYKHKSYFSDSLTTEEIDNLILFLLSLKCRQCKSGLTKQM